MGPKNQIAKDQIATNLIAKNLIAMTRRGVPLLIAGAFAGMIAFATAAAPARAADASASTAKSADTGDMALKSALQKRLLVASPNDIQLGPPTNTPVPGVSSRTVTVTNAEGQKLQVELFFGAHGDKGILTQRFEYFDIANPWQRINLKPVHLTDRATLGPADAPVTIIEFADFQCPFCRRAFDEIETLVNTTYKGRVKLIWKNFPLNIHPWAEQAAIAAECARQQNPQQFWEFARGLYRDQDEITPENLREHIDSYTSALGLDGKALNACILGKTAEAQVEEDKKDAQAIQVNSTPTFFVNGIPVAGLPSSNVFDFVINQQLQERHAKR
jgi:protein-disulfide isomerase